MKATQFLLDNHKILRGLFAQIDTSDLRAPEMTDGILRELRAELEIHTKIEEEIFYPILKDALPDEHKGLIDQSVSDHDEVKRMLGDRDAISDLVDSVEAHMFFEETRVFTLAENVLADKLDELGERLESRARELKDSPEYADSRPSVVQNPHGGEQSRKKSAA